MFIATGLRLTIQEQRSESRRHCCAGSTSRQSFSACLAENPDALKLEDPRFYARNARRITSHRPLGVTGNSQSIMGQQTRLARNFIFFCGARPTRTIIRYTKSHTGGLSREF